MTITDVAAIAKRVMLEQGKHAPMLVVEGTGMNGIVELGTLPGDYPGKHDAMMMAGFSVAKEGKAGELKQLFFVSEAWISQGEDGKPPQTRPSEDPNRREVLVIGSVRLPERREELMVYALSRNERGEFVGLDELPELAGGSPRSFLLDSFLKGFEMGSRRTTRD